MNTEDIKKLIKGTKTEDISFVPYFYTKKEERPDISDKLVKKKIKDTKSILGIQKQKVKGKERYR